MRPFAILAALFLLLQPGSLSAQDWDSEYSPIRFGEEYAHNYLGRADMAAAYFRALSDLGLAVPSTNAEVAEVNFWEALIARGLHLDYGLPEDITPWQIQNRLGGYRCRDTYIRRDLFRLMQVLPEDDAYLDAWIRDRLKLAGFCGDKTDVPAPANWAVLSVDDPIGRSDADAAYFNAAVQYYAENYEAASGLFEAIARDPNSPHQSAARIMLVDIWSGVNWDIPFSDPAHARAVIQNWDEDPTQDGLSQWSYETAIGILTYATQSLEDARLDAQTTLSLLTQSNTSLRADPTLRRRFTRVLDDLDEFLCMGYRSEDCPDGPRSAAMMESLDSSPVARFLHTAINVNQELRPTSNIYYFYNLTLRMELPDDADIPATLAPLDREGLPWLALAMEFAVPGNSALPEIQARTDALAARVADGTATEPELVAWPGLFRSRLRQFLQVGDHQGALKYFDARQSDFSEKFLRLLQCDWAGREILLDEPDRARDVLALLPPDPADYEYYHACPITFSFFLAQSLDEALTIAQGTLPERSKAAFLDLLPTEQALHAISGEEFNTDYRMAATRAILARSLILKDEGLWRGGMEILSQLDPDVAAELEGSGARGDALPAQDLIDLTLMRYPRLRLRIYHPIDPWFSEGDFELLGSWRAIDIYQHTANNYWCEYDPEESLEALRDDLFYELGFYPYYLSQEELQTVLPIIGSLVEDHPIVDAIDEIEVAKLAAVGAAPIYLPRLALQLSNRHRSGRTLDTLTSEDIAEGLHLAVRSTRYSCPSAEGRAKGSRAAWRRLDEDHRQSEWMERTPYWYREAFYDY